MLLTSQFISRSYAEGKGTPFAFLLTFCSLEVSLLFYILSLLQHLCLLQHQMMCLICLSILNLVQLCSSGLQMSIVFNIKFGFSKSL